MDTYQIPANCIVSEWNPCSVPCGKGTRTRTVIRQPDPNIACPTLSEDCNTQECPPTQSSIINIPPPKSDLNIILYCAIGVGVIILIILIIIGITKYGKPTDDKMSFEIPIPTVPLPKGFDFSNLPSNKYKLPASKN